MTVEEFIAKWENCSGSERANYAVFLTEFAGLLGQARRYAQCLAEPPCPPFSGSEDENSVTDRLAKL